MSRHCCPHMEERLAQTCGKHPSKYECPDILLDEHDDGAIGLIVHDGGNSMIVIDFCPWCGTQLPEVTDGRH